jgi:glycosyltransferase involved in cell wall biosynthesis
MAGQGASVPLPHISVCICTYKRPELLHKLLSHLSCQNTGGLFTYSIVIADNDSNQSAKPVVEEARSPSRPDIQYCIEPRQNIALARNTAVANASGDFLAFIDDDEFPIDDWLLRLFTARQHYGVDGVLGPVKRYFDQTPPTWLAKSTFYVRPIFPTGTKVDWQESRTGNVLLRQQLVVDDAMPFRPQFRAGEDNDFFRRQIEKGRTFIWSQDADVFEIVPPVRWSRRYLMRKALLRGATAALQTNGIGIAKSIIAVPVYVLTLPLTVLGGHQRTMTQLVKLCDHIGKLLMLAGINPIHEEYVSDQQTAVQAEFTTPATRSRQNG